MSLSKAVTIDWCNGSHKSVNTLISREPETTTPFTAWATQVDKPLLHKWGADWKLTLNEVRKPLKMRVFPGSVNATKSGSGLLKLQKYQADSVNVCQHILFKLNLQSLSLFQEPNLQSNDQVTRWERPILVMKTGWDTQGQNLSTLLTQRTCWCTQYLFTFLFPVYTSYNTSHYGNHCLGLTSCQMLNIHSSSCSKRPPKWQPLSWGLCNIQHGLFSF